MLFVIKFILMFNFFSVVGVGGGGVVFVVIEVSGGFIFD